MKAIEQATAKEHGVEDILALDNATPADRLTAIGHFGEGVPSWQGAVQFARSAIQGLAANDIKPTSVSDGALAVKTAFYAQIVKTYNQDDDFKHLMDQLSQAIPAHGDDLRLGVPLWEAVFFGNFSTKFLPDELLNIGLGVVG